LWCKFTMKQFFVGILAVLYLAVSSGVVMEVHYCMGKIAGVELYGGHDDICGKCGMTEKKGGCCSDELKIYKLEDSHKNVTNAISFNGGETAVLTTYPEYDWLPAALPAAVPVPVHSPPDTGGPALNIIHCVFRI
jgi:hypothetical protein